MPVISGIFEITLIHLEPGEVQIAHFTIPGIDLAYYNPESKTWEVEEMAYQVYTGSSSAEADLLKGDFLITVNSFAGRKSTY